MKKTLLALAALAFAISMHNTVQASGDPDHNKYHIADISWIKANQDDLDKDDKYVVLCGKVTQKIDSDTYIFNDGTGKITLDTDDGIELPVGKSIVVRGEIDTDFFGNDVTGNDLEVNVRSWRKQ